MNSVEDVIRSLDKQERVIVQHLRSLVLECLPKAEEKVSYGVPFYRHNRMICFIWPPSIYWGEGRSKEKQLALGVTLGFCQGNRMSNDEGSLLSEGRKQVYCMYFKRLDDVDDQQVRALLFEAESIDDSFRKPKKTARNRQ